MVKINSNNEITLTRGDSLTLTVDIKKDGEPYVIQSGDSLRFALAKVYKGASGYQLLIEKTIPTDSLTFTILSEETEVLDCGVYKYDIEMTHGDGSVDTFISSTFSLTGEVE